MIKGTTSREQLFDRHSTRIPILDYLKAEIAEVALRATCKADSVVCTPTTQNSFPMLTVLPLDKREAERVSALIEDLLKEREQ